LVKNNKNTLENPVLDPSHFFSICNKNSIPFKRETSKILYDIAIVPVKTDVLEIMAQNQRQNFHSTHFDSIFSKNLKRKEILHLAPRHALKCLKTKHVEVEKYKSDERKRK
jgi:hypothetical protein